MLAAGWSAPRLAAQGVITITVNNPSFESPTPSTFPDYTVGATDWTLVRGDIDGGTFAPGGAVTPGPVDGNQVGYSNGAGGLQQVLGATFATGTTYFFSVSIGVRSDDLASTGAAAIQLGYFLGNGDFNLVTAQSGAAARGVFSGLTGSYQAAAGDAGQTIVVRLANTGSPQVVFDQVSVSATAIPEPAVAAGLAGAVALIGAAGWKRWRRRGGNTTMGRAG